MYLAATVLFSLFLSVAQAAPTKPPTTTTSKPQLKPLLPEPNPLVKKLVVFDSTCTADHTKRIALEQALSDLYDVAEVAQHITEKDVAFNNYFITDAWAKSPAMLNKVYGPNAPDRDDIKLVPNMAKSILTGGGKDKKFTVKCPALKDGCENKFASVRPSEPMMYICPDFFSMKAVHSLSSRPFTLNGWCKPPKHLLSNYLTGVETIAHEMTHMEFIASHALEISLPEPASHPIQWFTQDIANKPDENDPKNLATYGGTEHYFAARVLKQRWHAYTQQVLDSMLDPHKPMHLHEPPLETSDNAESYALAFIEYYFFKKCQHLGFNPNEVVLSH